MDANRFAKMLLIGVLIRGCARLPQFINQVGVYETPPVIQEVVNVQY